MATLTLTSSVSVKRIVDVSKTTSVKRLVVQGVTDTLTVQSQGIASPSPVKVVSSEATFVKKVVAGTPVRRVKAGDLVDVNTLSLTSLLDVDADSPNQGDVLVFQTSTNKFTSQNDLEEQNVNGGQY